MNILNIAIKEIKHSVRDIRTFVFMLAFPIVLMLILGTALSNAFNSKLAVDDIHVLYKITADPMIATSFQSFIKEAEKSGVQFKQISGNLDGKNEVKENNFSAYIEVTNDGIQLYGTSRNSIEESIIQGMLSAYAGRYNVVASVAKVDPSKVSTALASHSEDHFIKEKSLNSKKQPGSMDYYAMAMTTMIALYAALGASSLIRGERTRNTSIRLLTAPISKGEIFLGKIIGALLINITFVMVIVAFSSIAFKANWGNHFGMVFLVLATEVFLSVSFGLGVSYLAKTGEAARTILMIVIQLSSFFGGAYFKIDDAKGISITNLSPLTWANNAVTKIIYANDYLAAIKAISLNMGIAIIFLAISIILLRKREGL
ncbi:ABC transporter permease [Bacillus sp. BRMEA1]|uniref:ABC transporter permease n=1 Tax=Neobacillus endophyticus TaxID=2738405 RepID=UPI001563D504|nr:ABC transporter permease [Neobacillus endophyticus]NRD78695.1 ABC transporter permease [Neobacillus endophyticus]